MPIKRRTQKRVVFKNIKRTLSTIILITTIFIIYYVIFRSDMFLISDIQINGASEFVHEADLKEVIKTNSYGKNIITYSSNEIQKKISDFFQGAKEMYVYKSYPHTLVVNVIERAPIAIIQSSSNAEKFLVDDDGYILGIIDSNPHNYPVITYEGDIKVGTFIQKDLVPMYSELIKTLDTERIKVSSVSFYPKYSKVTLDSSAEVFLSNEKSINDSIKIVREILNQLETEKKLVKKIDLRYDKVIVSYE